MTDSQGAGAKASPISELLDMVACEAIGASLDILAEGDELSPSVYYAASADDIEQVVFSDDGPDACLEAARGFVRSLGEKAQVYAIAYDGFVQDREDIAGEDAVIVEFGERGERCAFSASVAYSVSADGTLAYGEPQPAGEEILLLA